MAKPKQLNLYYRAEAALWFTLMGGLKLMSAEHASGLCASVLPALGQLASANTTAMRNLRMAYPNETEAWRHDVLRAVWAEIGRMTGEFPHMPEFVDRFEHGDIVFEGAEKIRATRGKGAVFIGGHFTNWEVITLCLAQTDPDCYFTYRPANNPIIDHYIIDTRRAFGLDLQAAKGRTGGMGLLRALTKKQSVALMNDQKYNTGVAAPLFGYDCMTADGPTRLALRFRVPLIPIVGRRTSGLRFHVKVYDPIALDYDAPSETAALAGVRRVNAFLEERIREAPEQWFWVHRRWPKDAWRKAGVM